MNATSYAHVYQEDEWLLDFIITQLPEEEQAELEPVLSTVPAEARWEMLLEKAALAHSDPQPPPGVFLQIKQQIKQREQADTLPVSEGEPIGKPLFFVCKCLALAGAGTTLFFLILRLFR